MPAKNHAHEAAIRQVADGDLSVMEIAALTGVPHSTAKKILARCPDIPRRRPGPPRGERNPDWQGGRSVDRDGYATVPAPEDHPYARSIGRIAEHRLVMERKMGRQLLRSEVVDHIDGLTLHNAPENLRLFARNGDHLRETLAGRKKAFSASGHRSILQQGRQPEGWTPVDTHRRRRERGDLRLRAILLVALKFGPDSPFLLGTRRLLEKAGMHPLDRPTIERAWADLCQRWQADLDL